ncbi:Dihydroneopterin aldolase [hydrothermal vent metagenome]|uniref:dihydroneopterin aldolase n=1 Tax=hydrothermal vent metagenome TaxID=652676 RepID=A0A1W1BAH8_9ZZZZ
MYSIITIEELRFECIIGILKFERKEPQKVIVDVEIGYDDNEGFIDYAKVVKEIKKSMKKQKFLLIEDAHRFLQKKLKKKFPKILKLKIKITKPSILPDCRVAVATNKQFDS